MRWFNNKSISRVVQWFLLIGSSFNGFLWGYLFGFYLIGVAISWWLIVGSLMLAVSSTYGLFYWMVNN